MHVEVVEAQPFHCGRLSRTLRHEHKSVMAKMGIRTHRELRSRFESSSFRKAMIIDGELVALGGLDASLTATEAWVWLALSDKARAHTVSIVREAKRQIHELLKVRHSLATFIMEDDKRSVDLAHHLGFLTKEKATINGLVISTMVINRKGSS